MDDPLFDLWAKVSHLNKALDNHSISRTKFHRSTQQQASTAFCFYSKTGASIPPKAMMHFPPISDFPPLFRVLEKLSQLSNILKNVCMLHPTKVLMTFFSH